MSRTLLDRFNDTIDQWIGYVEMYSLDELRKKHIPGSWSLGQILVHITEDTPYHVQQMKAALLDTTNTGKEMHDDAKIMFGNNAFPDMLIAGASTDASVRQPYSKEELKQLLTSIKKDVNDLYSAFDFQSSKGKSAHPGLWYFTAAEWLQFTEMHMRHHFRQKKRLDEAGGVQ